MKSKKQKNIEAMIAEFDQAMEPLMILGSSKKEAKKLVKSGKWNKLKKTKKPVMSMQDALSIPDESILYPELIKELLLPLTGDVLSVYLGNQGFSLDPKVVDMLNRGAHPQYLDWVLNGGGDINEEPIDAIRRVLKEIHEKERPAKVEPQLELLNQIMNEATND